MGVTVSGSTTEDAGGSVGGTVEEAGGGVRVSESTTEKAAAGAGDSVGGTGGGSDALFFHQSMPWPTDLCAGNCYLVGSGVHPSPCHVVALM